MALAEDSSGQAWLAAAGGMFTTADPTTSWTAVDLSSSGSLNPLFSDIASNGDSIAAVSLLPLSILPSQYSGLLSGRVFFKSAGETDWEELGTGLRSNYTAAVALSDTDGLYVGTLDQGVWHYDNDTWTAIDGGPSDVIALEWDADGLSVASANRGVWRYQNLRWSQVGEAPVTGLSGGKATGTDGSIGHWKRVKARFQTPHRARSTSPCPFTPTFTTPIGATPWTTRFWCRHRCHSETP